jgi:hypothetical protein
MDIRKAPAEEAENIVALLRSVYGETYRVTEMYDAEYMRNAITRGKMNIVVASDGDTLAGMVCAKTDERFPGCLMYTTFLVRPEYRNSGLGWAIAKTGKQFENEIYTSAFNQSATGNLKSQAIDHGLGYMPTGLLIERVLLDTHNRVDNRGTLLVMSKPLGKNVAGKLYLPDEAAEIVPKAYKGLGVALSELPEDDIAAETRVMDSPEQNFSVFIGELPAILPERASIDLYLNMNSPDCPGKYEDAKKRGFFYAGIHPLVLGAEYLIMHKPASPGISFKTISTLAIFSEHLEFIKESNKNAAQY